MDDEKLAEAQRQFEEASKKKDRVNGDLQRLQGKQESAQASLGAVEKECRDRGVEPEKLDAVIDKLQGRYIKAVANVVEKTDEAEENLKPFLGQSGETS